MEDDHSTFVTRHRPPPSMEIPRATCRWAQAADHPDPSSKSPAFPNTPVPFPHWMPRNCPSRTGVWELFNYLLTNMRSAKLLRGGLRRHLSSYASTASVDLAEAVVL